MDADAAAMAAAKKNLPEAKQILADGFRCELPEVGRLKERHFEGDSGCQY